MVNFLIIFFLLCTPSWATFIPEQVLELTAFDELLVAEPTPQVHLQFPYNLNTNLVEIRENNSGTCTQDQGMAVIQSGSSATSACHMLSRTAVRYNPGQGSSIKFTASFTTGKAGSVQIAGMGEVGDGLFVGFNGVDFSIDRREQGQKEIQTLSISAGASGSGNVTINLDGQGTTVALTAGDTAREVAVKIADTDFGDAGLGWSADVDSSTVIFRAWSSGDKTGVFDFQDTGSTSASGTSVETVAGITTINNWINQSNFNLDKLDGSGNSGMTIDPTKLNVYEIQFEYLGAGAILYRVENPTTGRFITFHLIQYANENIIPSLQNPSLPLHIMSKNTTNATNLTVKTASMGGFIEGIDRELGLVYGESNLKTGVGTTETPIISIKNNLVYQGVENRVRIDLDGMNVSSDGTKLVTIRLLRNATLTGTPNFTTFASDVSVISVDTDATGVITEQGSEILALQLGKSDSKEVPLKQFDLMVSPGEIITITGQTQAASSDIGVSLHWEELF